MSGPGNTFPQLNYQIVFPEGTVIKEDKIKITSTSKAIHIVDKKIKDNVLDLAFKYHNWSDYGTFFGLYEQDLKGNPLINIEVPYEVMAKQGKDYDSYVISGKGESKLEYSHWLVGTIVVADIKTDELKLPLFTAKQDKPLNIPYKGTLEGDLLSNGNTQHDAALPLNTKDKINFTGSLIVKPIKQQMALIENQHNVGQPNFENITLKDSKFNFTADITFPMELNIPTFTKDNVVLEGVADTFEVTEVKTSGNKVTVTFGLKQNLIIDNYKQLKDAVNKVEDTINITLNDITVKEDKVNNDQLLTTVGKVNGTFTSTANLNSKTINFDFIWDSKQLPSGRDALAQDDTTIQLTHKVVKESKPVIIPLTPLVPAKKHILPKTGSLSFGGLAFALAGLGLLLSVGGIKKREDNNI
ncbi:MAG: hypothetical protein SPI53_02205 [Erysipelotrichaceae bacterium]|nr:hypothetical protein [Erysipelotrichaceae bacterium]